jgi:uncharacterized membrane protein YbhN (UPF0104 family)
MPDAESSRRGRSISAASNGGRVSRKALFSTAIIVAKLAVTVIIFWLILRSIDLIAAGRAMQRVSGADLGLALALLGGQVAINGVRWSIIAKSSGMNIRLMEAIRWFWEGLFFGQITPSGVGGDAWRVYSAAKRGAAVANSMNSVVMDRLVGTAALLLMVGFGFAAEVVVGNSVDATELAVGAGLALALAVGVLFLLAVQKLPDRERAWDRFGLIAACVRASALLGKALVRPQLLFLTIALSVVGQVLCATSVWVLARSAGFDPGLNVCLVLVPVALLISMVPITIAGWGLREGVLAAGLVRAGATLETAAAISVLFGLALAFIGLTGGVSMWFARRRADPQMRQDQTSNVA